MAGFSLLRLPPKAAQEVIEQVDIADRIALSFCSKRSKSLVKNTDWKIASLTVIVDSIFNIYASAADGKNLFHVDFDDPSHIIVGSLAKEELCFKIEAFGIGDWIRYIASIANDSKIDGLWIRLNILPVESIKEVMKGLEWRRLQIDHGVPPQYREDVLNQLLPRTQLLSYGPTFNGSCKFLLQNLESLCVPHSLDMKLDHLQMANASCLTHLFVNLQAKDLNRFIKLFIAGTNPRLKCLFFYCRQNIWSFHTVMKGVKYAVIRGTTAVKTYNFDYMKFQDKEWNDAIEIFRDDGTKAAIRLKRCDIGASFRMFVHD